MVVVKIELWPLGDETQAKQIGEIRIANVGGDQETGIYDAQLAHAGVYWGRPGAYKTARAVTHLRRLSPYHLLLRVLTKALGRA